MKRDPRYRSRLSDEEIQLAVQAAQLKPINDAIWKQQTEQFPAFCIDSTKSPVTTNTRRRKETA